MKPKEIPMLFSTEMVQAILAGEKTQTRRPVDPKLFMVREPKHVQWWPEGIMAYWTEDEQFGRVGPYKTDRAFAPGQAQVGDRIWVRETVLISKPKHSGATGYLIYKADRGAMAIPEGKVRWTPSIHMPRWASRITLEITAIRMERLQDITEEDARSEGVKPMHLDDLGQSWKTYRRGFQAVWEKQYGAEAWKKNGLVWVINFRKLRK